MELDHLHVLQADARPVGKRHTVARAYVAVGGEGVDASQDPGGEDHGFGGDGVEPATAHIEGDHAHAAAVLDQQLGDKGFVMAGDLWVLQRRLEDRVQHVETGLVRGEAGAPGGHASKRPGRDLAVRVPAPWTAPVLHLDDLHRRLADKRLDHVLVGQVVRAFDGVERVALVRVFRAEGRRGSALGGDGVAAHRVDLRDHPHLDPGIGFDGSYRCPDAGEPSADDQDVIALHLLIDSMWTRELTA